MRRFPLLLLIIFADGVPTKKVCSYLDVLDYLNLTKDTGPFRLTRPVLDYTQPTIVELDILLYAILAVVEKTQTFIPFIWATLKWNHERISWDPDQFCGISEVAIPREMLWKPDIFIYEMIQKDDSPLNPYILVSSNGTIYSEEDLKVVSTCKMDVHKFPFDTQSCNITVASAIHHIDEMRLFPGSNSSRATQFSRQVMKTQGEWEFLQLSVTSTNIAFNNKTWDNLIYTFSMKRRPLLHVINFLLPVLFFLILDLASFFIADHRGEKLGFKVTVLLAISVLLLILNDILPAMSNETPLIATYCIVMFALMLLSLLETILVTNLIDKDLTFQARPRLKDTKTDMNTDNWKTDPDEKRQTCCSCIHKVSAGEKQLELLPVAEEVNGISQSRDSHVLLLILGELKEMQMNLNLNCRMEGGKSVLLAKRINRAFFIFYVSTVFLFLCFIFIEWHT
ncbi:5-hydroxytryptamine receptor 3A-like [Halichoeres trimaculatus]|uniref:5-hydroxytryptamine receptor 3A-like n=1 Tax=Halichoeres trimaculatus TaxID=147232 RepID=UPI003D9E5A57